MTESDTGRPAAASDRKAGVLSEAEKDLRNGLAGKPDAGTREAAKEAIDRATAAVGHDDGKR